MLITTHGHSVIFQISGAKQEQRTASCLLVAFDRALFSPSSLSIEPVPRERIQQRDDDASEKGTSLWLQATRPCHPLSFLGASTILPAKDDHPAE